MDSLDLTRQLGRVRADQVVVPAGPAADRADRRRWPAWRRSCFGAEAVGIADWAVHTAAEYAKIRHQFGRPIGQFQAVKHRCARMLVGGRAGGRRGLGRGARTRRTAARRQASEFAAAAAAVLAADAAVSCAHECIQVLGGIGYTWEHEAHLYYRRAMTLRALLGSSGRGGWKQRMAAAGPGRGRGGRSGWSCPAATTSCARSIRAELAAIAGLAGAERNAALGGRRLGRCRTCRSRGAAARAHSSS